MKKLFILTVMFLLFFLTTVNHKTYAGFETDFDAAFKVGDSEGATATFKFLGEEKTLSVFEVKEMLQKLGYSRYFANEEPGSGYTSNVDKAFKEYVESYEAKLKNAEEELNKAS